MVKEQVGKGAILSGGVACIGLGVALVKEGSIEYGIALILAGIVLAVIYVYLIERQAVKKAVAKLEERMVK